MAIDYKQAGVDIEAGDALVDWLKSNQPEKWPHQGSLVSGIGGFSALFRADFKDIEEPCLVSATDGIGTKLKVAVEFEEYSGVAQDLVAMCVNDLICCGAQPLFFLDYYATGKLRLEAAKDFLGGLQRACIEAECALIGGETAEMPGVYQGKDFDAAGFAVGVVGRQQVFGSHLVKSGDVVVGVASSGFHSNGFSLLRRLFAEDMSDWREALLTPTALYVKLSHKLKATGAVHALANITGGGMDNILRVLPKGSGITLSAWHVPAPFVEAKKRSASSWAEILKTLNCGVGLAIVCEAGKQDIIMGACQEMGHSSFVLGEVSCEQGQESSWTLAPAWESM